MNKENNIEELFRSTFEAFEAPVDPSVWTAIQSGIAAKTAGTAIAAKTGAGIVKTLIISGSTLMAGLGLGYVFFGNTTNNTSQKKSGQQVSARVESQQEEKQSGEFISSNETSANTQTEENVIIPVHNHTTGKKEKITITVPSEDSRNQSIVNSWLAPDAENWKRYYEERARDEANHKKENVSSEKAREQEKVPVDVQTFTESTPMAAIQASVYAGPAPLVVSFSNGSEEQSYHWDFGNGNTSDEANPKEVFDEPGRYTVKLTVTGKSGKTDVNRVEIEVFEGSEITTVPNVFTPTRDGYNDEYRVLGKNLVKFEMHIYSKRTGTEVFYSNDINRGWNGEDLKGNPMPGGNYVVIVRASGSDGKVHEKNTEMVLIRKNN